MRSTRRCDAATSELGPAEAFDAAFGRQLSRSTVTKPARIIDPNTAGRARAALLPNQIGYRNRHFEILVRPNVTHVTSATCCDAERQIRSVKQQGDRSCVGRHEARTRLELDCV